MRKIYLLIIQQTEKCLLLDPPYLHPVREASHVCLRSHRTLQKYAYAETKTMTHTVGVVVGVAYMLTWPNHRSAGVVT